MKVLFVNNVLGFGSTGKIVANLASMKDVEPLICFGRKKNYSSIKNIYKTTNIIGNIISVFETVLFDKQGFTNKLETKKLIKKIDEFKPEIVHLHVLHGYYINMTILLNYLKNKSIPVIWTQHDCWAFTGYCPYFDLENCDKWKTECKNCKKSFSYPFSIFKQNTKKNYYARKKLLENFNNLTIVTPSKWLEKCVQESFINQNVITINNGIDLTKFYPITKKSKKFSIIFVAGVWTKTKGIEEMERIIPLIDNDVEIYVVGTLVKKSKVLSDRCNLISHTNDIKELASLYSKAHLFINLTLEENFPTVNIEALACGTPVITYDTGGSPEIIDNKCGIVVDKYNYKEVAKLINSQKENYTFNYLDCVERSKKFPKEKMYEDYYNLYRKLLSM